MDIANELLLVRVERPRVCLPELVVAVDQLRVAEAAAVDRDPPEADVLLGDEEEAAASVGDHPLGLRQFVDAFLARRPRAVPRERERRMKLEPIDPLEPDGSVRPCDESHHD
jgi:hypothetical protein